MTEDQPNGIPENIIDETVDETSTDTPEPETITETTPQTPSLDMYDVIETESHEQCAPITPEQIKEFMEQEDA